MCNGTICEKCYPVEVCKRLEVIIAQNQRQADLSERANGYDNPPLFLRVPATVGGTIPATNTDYKLPLFEMGGVITYGIFTTDCTASDIGIFIYHPSIVLPGNRYQIAEFQGTGTFELPKGGTIAANSQIGFRFNALTAGTYASLSIAYNRSEQTGIEWMRSQRVGRIG